MATQSERLAQLKRELDSANIKRKATDEYVEWLAKRIESMAWSRKKKGMRDAGIAIILFILTVKMDYLTEASKVYFNIGTNVGPGAVQWGLAGILVLFIWSSFDFKIWSRK